jgi:hypothetical protein
MPAPDRVATEVPDLNRWLPAPVVRTRHRREAPTTPQRLWRAASAVRLDQTRTLGRLVGWRIPGTDQRQTFRELLAGPPFAVLDAGPTHSLSGLCGRIWTLRRDYPPLADAAAFEAWDEPGTVRVLFAHWTAPTATGAELISEARVQPCDARAHLALGVLWRTVRIFERHIGAEALSLAVDMSADPPP